MFHHRHGGGDKHLVETMSGGGGFWDYDGDGDLDVYLLNGSLLSNALYRNEDGHFREVTEEAALKVSGYSMGCAAAEYDNHGDLDLFVSGFGPGHLFRNEGDGTFTEVTEAAGVGAAEFAASAAFADIEADGDLDLYVTTYIEYRLDNPVYCGDRRLGVRTYCHPNNYPGAPDILYRNAGDGTFADVSVEAGVSLKDGRGLGVIFTDYDGDGDPDIYVANDTMMNDFYRNLGDGTYADTTYGAGLALPSLPWVGFGTGFFDFDKDADPDLFVANGHIMDHASALSEATRYAQPKQLYENEGGRYYDVSTSAGEPFERDQVGRGAAFGDWDDDGDPDVLVMNNNDVPNLLRNETENENHWTLLRLIGRESNRDGVGAWVRIEAGGRNQIDELRCGYSYLSMNDLRLHFGLGSAERIATIEIRWPSGRNETFDDLPVDSRFVILEAEGVYRLP